MKEMTRIRNPLVLLGSGFASSVVGHPDSWTQQKFEFCCVIKGRVRGGGQGSVVSCNAFDLWADTSLVWMNQACPI